ncbi:MAG: amino acid--tRNA ligase-related protein, partial [Thermoproteota archaeon]
MKLHNPLWKDFRNKDVVRLPAGSRVRIAGWAHAIRDLGGIVFLLVRDSDGLVQVVASKSELDEKTFNAFKGVKPETVLSIEGVVKQSPKAPRGVEIKALSLSILNEANVPSHLEPSSRGRISLDERLDNRTLDLRKPRNMAIFKFQSSLVKHIREYLHLHGFVEVFTPRLIATATEGGAALFPIAYFDKEAFLAQSPQLYKEQLSSVFERVYEIGPLFRAEESQTDR